MWYINEQYLIFIVDLLVSQVGNWDLIVGDLPDLMLRSLVWFSRVEKISKSLIVDLHKAGSEGVLKIPTQKQSIHKQTMRRPQTIPTQCMPWRGKKQQLLCRPYLPPLLLECFGRLENLLDSTWNDSPQVLQIGPLHSKGLPAASLAISKATNVVPIQSRLYQQGDLFENLTLRVTRPEHTIEAEVIALLSVSRAPCVRLRTRRGNLKGCWSHSLGYTKFSLSLRFIGCMLVCYCRDLNFTVTCPKHQLWLAALHVSQSVSQSQALLGQWKLWLGPVLLSSV